MEFKAITLKVLSAILELLKIEVIRYGFDTKENDELDGLINQITWLIERNRVE